MRDLSYILHTFHERKVPLITHNGFNDILHVLLTLTQLYRWFLRPEGRQEEGIHSSHHNYNRDKMSKIHAIYDTKYMSILFNQLYSVDNSFTELNNTFKHVKEDKEGVYASPLVSVVDGIYDGDVKSHEASYDAFITGYVFAKFARRLQFLHLIREQEKSVKKAKKTTSDKSTGAKYMGNCVNRVALGGIKVPYNFTHTSITADNYAEDGSQLYHCIVTLYNDVVKSPSEVVDHVKTVLGDITSHFIFSQQVEFYFTYKEAKECKKYMKHMKMMEGCAICRL